jgi:hypothetical protein
MHLAFITKTWEVNAMSNPIEVIEFELIPIPPDTVASVKEELMPLIEATLREAGQSHLLSDEHIQIEFEQTAPIDNQTLFVVLTFLSAAALETYKLILKRIDERYPVKKKSRTKKKKARKNKK